MSNLTQLMNQAIVGDVSSSETLLAHFKDQTLTANEQDEVHIFLKAAATKSHHAIYLRGLLYDNGYGVKQDHDMAYLLLREAAAKGNAKATYEVGHRFLYGIGVEASMENALQWLEIAAGSPHYVPDAMYDLGIMYEQGLGSEADLVQAKRWYEKAAQKGHLKAKEKIMRWPS